MDIYKIIKQDHDTQRDLCDKLLQTSGGSEERKELWIALKKELEVHALAEERHFYKPLISTDAMQEDARHGIAEHHEMDELIEELESTDMTASNWKTICEKLVHKVKHHLEDEEGDFFKKAKDLYSVEKAADLATDYENTMSEYRASWPQSIPG